MLDMQLNMAWCTRLPILLPLSLNCMMVQQFLLEALLQMTLGAVPVTTGKLSVSLDSSSPHASADTACVVVHLPSPLTVAPPPTMIPRVKVRYKSSLMSFTSAPKADRGLGSWR